jgi:hypothetical protein
MQDQYTRHPEIDQEVIAAPVIVAGLPRSGTTHLVNLLAADSRFRSLPLWELLEPVPNPRERAPGKLGQALFTRLDHALPDKARDFLGVTTLSRRTRATCAARASGPACAWRCRTSRPCTP